MKCYLGISNFLEEISSLSHSVVFLYFFALIADLWNSAFRYLYLSFSPLLFTSLLSTAICKASSESHFGFLHFFSMGMVLIPVSCTMSRISVHSSSGKRIGNQKLFSLLSLAQNKLFHMTLQGLNVIGPLRYCNILFLSF